MRASQQIVEYTKHDASDQEDSIETSICAPELLVH